METLETTCTCRHTSMTIDTTRRTEFIDVTGELQALVARGGLRFGLINVQTRHTTTGIVVNEHEPLLLSDFEAFLTRIAPDGLPYRHDDETIRVVNRVPGERSNGHAHCQALLLPSSVCLNVVDGVIQLGRWQRVFFVELDGARSRQVSVLTMGNGA